MCNSLETRTSNLSPAEEEFLGVKPLTIDKPINNKWIKSLGENVRKKVVEFQGRAAEAEAKINADKVSLVGMTNYKRLLNIGLQLWGYMDEFVAMSFNMGRHEILRWATFIRYLCEV